MRFPGFSSPGRQSFKLGGPLGDQKVAATVAGHELRLCTLGGEVRSAAVDGHAACRPAQPFNNACGQSLHTAIQLLEAHALASVTWQPCVLPSKEHGLSLHVAGTASNPPREVLLRAKSAVQVADLQQQLCAAGLEHAQQQQEQHAQEEQQQQQRWAIRQERLLGSPATAAQEQEQEEEDSWEEEPGSPVQRSLSFGSPVVDDAHRLAAVDGGSNGRHHPAGPTLAAGSPSDGAEASDVEQSEPEDGKGSPSLQRWHPPSAPASPVLPGLPLVERASDRGIGRCPCASAPASPAPALAVSLAQQPLQLPVRLLSFSGRPGGDTVQSHVQRLEEAVAQLSAELASSRAASPDKAPVVAADWHGSSKPKAPEPRPSQGAPAAAAPTPDVAGADVQAPAAASSSQPPALNNSSSSGSTASSSRQVELLVQENTLLLQQHAAMQAELGRMQHQLSAAAADNIRLAQEAAAAMRQLSAAAEVLHSGQQREQQLHASLVAAVGQCEAVGRELAGLSGKLEARTAQCEELRYL